MCHRLDRAFGGVVDAVAGQLQAGCRARDVDDPPAGGPRSSASWQRWNVPFTFTRKLSSNSSSRTSPNCSTSATAALLTSTSQLTAEQRGEAVGYALVRTVPAGPRLETGDRVGELASLSVLPSSRGLGAGSRADAEVHRWLADLGVTTLTTSVLTNNSNALRFYKRLEMVELSVDLLGPVATTVPER